jgi:chromate transporter
MSENLHLAMHWHDWLELFLHYCSLSFLAIGGAITTVPEMHRFLVVEHHWLTDAQFNASISMAQAAPGPNVLFVALMGWNVGLNAGSMALGLLGMIATMSGILLPSTVLTYFTAQWGHRNRELRAVRAFKQGMAPIVVALLIATGWLLAHGGGNPAEDWKNWLLALLSALVIWRTRLHLLWLLAAGALLGALGMV